MTSLSLRSEETSEPARTGSTALVVLVVILFACVAGLGFLAYRFFERTRSIEGQLASLSARTEQSTALSRQALERATAAEAAARAAAEGRQAAEKQAAGAREEADVARQEATSARETAARAQAEADRI